MAAVQNASLMVPADILDELATNAFCCSHPKWTAFLEASVECSALKSKTNTESESILKVRMTEEDLYDIYNCADWDLIILDINSRTSDIIKARPESVVEYTKIEVYQENCEYNTEITKPCLDDDSPMVYSPKDTQISFHHTETVLWFSNDEEELETDIEQSPVNFRDRQDRTSVQFAAMLACFAEKVPFAERDSFFQEGSKGHNWLHLLPDFIPRMEYIRYQIDTCGKFCLSDQNLKYGIYPIRVFNHFERLFKQTLESQQNETTDMSLDIMDGIDPAVSPKAQLVEKFCTKNSTELEIQNLKKEILELKSSLGL